MPVQLHAKVQIAHEGKPAVEIVVADNAPAPTERAAQELAQALEQITGAHFILSKSKSNVGAIFVGQSSAAMAVFSEIKDLTGEEIVFQSKDANLLLMGGGPRGDPYAVTRFSNKPPTRNRWPRIF